MITCILWVVGWLDFSEQTPNEVISSACLHSLKNQLLSSYLTPRQVETNCRKLGQGGLEGLVLFVRRCLLQNMDISFLLLWPLRVSLTLLCTLRMPFVLFLMEHGTDCLECLESAEGNFFSLEFLTALKIVLSCLQGLPDIKWLLWTWSSMGVDVWGLLTAVLFGQQKRSDTFSHLC